MGHGQYAKASGNNNHGMPQMTPQMVNVQIPDVNQCASFHCPNCMNNIFEQAVRIWEISAVLSPTGIAQPANQPVWRCTACGLAWDQAALKRLSPKEREELIAGLKAKQAEMQKQTTAPTGEGEVVETLPVPEGLT